MPSSSSRWSPCESAPAGSCSSLGKADLPQQRRASASASRLPLHPVKRHAGAPAPRQHRHQHVLQHRQAREDVHDLERARQSLANPVVNGEPRDRFALEIQAPQSGTSAPVTRLMSVVLPAPFGPMMAVSLPGGQRQRHAVRPPRSRRSASRRRSVASRAVTSRPPHAARAARASRRCSSPRSESPAPGRPR